MQKRILPLNKLIENLQQVLLNYKQEGKDKETLKLIEFVIQNLEDYIRTTHTQKD